MIFRITLDFLHYYYQMISITISDIVATDPPRIVPTATCQSAMKNATRIKRPDKGLSTKQVYRRKNSINSLFMETNYQELYKVLLSSPSKPINMLLSLYYFKMKISVSLLVN